MSYAFITGGSGGIGEAVALELSQNGFNVGIQTNKNIENAENICKKTGGDYFVCNFENMKDIDKMCEDLLKKHPKIDILVNAAGISKTGLFTDFNLEDSIEIFKVNTFSQMQVTRNILPSMIKRKYGKIINIASMWGEVGASCEVDYSASKGAVIAFTKALAKETAPSGITVNCVSPGAVNTKMMSIFSENEIKEVEDDTPLGRLGEPWEIAKAVRFLASHEADFITGEIMRVNGGMVI